MVYEIQEISTDAETGHTYVHVDFWQSAIDKAKGLPPHLTEEFLMQLRGTGTRCIQDVQGRLKQKDGTYIDLAALTKDEKRQAVANLDRETFSRDLTSEIDGNIQRFMQMATVKGLSGDMRGGHGIRRRDQSDPHGVLAHAEVASMRTAIAQRKASK